MKTSILIAAAGATAMLSACATTPQTPVYEAAATTFTGYVVFTDNEFQLYPREAQIRTPFSRPCLSGALPRDAMWVARTDMSGQRVTFTGHTAPWTGKTITHEASDIRNTCGGAFVLLADDVEVLR